MTEVQPARGTTDITPLPQPLRVGRLTLENRFAMPGMQRAWCEDGAPTARPRDCYRRRAEGGTARGARTAKELGADGVEVHACHGYPLDQFP